MIRGCLKGMASTEPCYRHYWTIILHWKHQGSQPPHLAKILCTFSTEEISIKFNTNSHNRVSRGIEAVTVALITPAAISGVMSVKAPTLKLPEQPHRNASLKMNYEVPQGRNISEISHI